MPRSWRADANRDWRAGIDALGFAAGAASWHPCARMKRQAAERRVVRILASFAVAFVVLATATRAEPQPAEPHLTDVRRLTEGGENAEAYWSPDGEKLIFQRTAPESSAGGSCDQIYRLDL